MLDRHLVGAEKGRHHGHRMARGRVADGLEGADLGRGLEAVAALDLGRRGPAHEHLVEAREHEGGQGLARGRPGGRDRPDDAAARGRDLRIGGAGQPLPDLLVAVAREREVGVTVDEPRHHGRVLCVDRRGPRGHDHLTSHVGLGADPGDAPGRRRQRRAFPDRGLAQGRAGPRRRTGEGEEAADVADDEVGGGAHRLRRRAYRLEPCSGLGRGHPGHEGPLATTGGAAQQPDRRRGHAQGLTQHPGQGGVGLAFDRGGGETHHEGSLAIAFDGVARRARLDVHGQGEAALALLEVESEGYETASSRRFKKRRLSSSSVSSWSSRTVARRVMRARMSVRMEVR